MKSPSRYRPTIAQLALVPLLVIAGFSPSSGGGNLLAGHARVTSVTAAPEMDAAMCELVPSSTSRTLYAAVRQQQSAAVAALERSPLRAIADPYGLYSAVGVDLVNDEVILQDENHFRILAYNRTANTPPSDLMTEPKRVINGDRTNLMLNSGLYVDPKNGDIYTVNNDSIDSTVVFSRQAKGNAAPDRNLHTPHGSFNIAVDEQDQEMFLTIEHSHAVVVFPKMANDEENPIRVLQGERTGLGDPHGIALDTRNGLIFVSNFGSTNVMRRSEANGNARGDGEGKGDHWPLDRDHAVSGSGRNVPPSITVYPKKSSGDTAPLRVIQGPRTQLDWPAAIAVDSERGELYVANDQGDSVLVFSASAKGDVAPLRVLKGPKTLIKYPNGLALDLAHDELWVASFGNHAATVYKRDASGDTAPLRVIRGGPLDASLPALGNPFSVAFDSKRDEILVPNCVAHPQIAAFARSANASDGPNRRIEGQKTNLARTMHGIGYDDIHDEIVVPQAFSQAVLTFRGGATGEEAPIRVIQGSLTQLKAPDRMAIDPVNNEIYIVEQGYILVFPREANGNVAPIRRLEGPDTGIAGFSFVAVDPIHNVLIHGGGGKIRIFDRTAHGNAKPKAIIGGPRSGFNGPNGAIAVHAPTGMIIAASRVSGTNGSQQLNNVGEVAVFSVNDKGDVAPRWTIGRGFLKVPRGVALDPETKSMIVSDKVGNRIVTFHLPEIF